jgi:hypothetical protein
MLFTKLNEGNIADWLEPSLTIDRKYPGTSNINKKNAITPMDTYNHYSISCQLE